MTKTVDTKCFDLACHFLDELENEGTRIPDGDRMELAQEIQDVIEDWILAYAPKGGWTR